MKVKYDLNDLVSFHDMMRDYIEQYLTVDGEEMFNEIGLILRSLEVKHGSHFTTERKTKRS